MAKRAIADAGFLIALLSRRDTHHEWAVSQAREYPPPWVSCEAALSEAFHLLGSQGAPVLSELLRRESVEVSFSLSEETEPVLRLVEKYASVPISLADACIVRMTETLPRTVVLSTDADFRIYRRHSRQVVPSILP